MSTKSKIIAVIIWLLVIGMFFFWREKEAEPIMSQNESVELSFIPYDLCYIDVLWQTGPVMTSCEIEGSYVGKKCDKLWTCIDVEREMTDRISIVDFPSQPTQLPWNYTDNWIVLRAWAEENKQSVEIPERAKDVKISFAFAKEPSYKMVPGNIQLSVDWKNYTNWRLAIEHAFKEEDSYHLYTNCYTYSLDNIITQDKPNGADLTDAIGKTLTIKAWIGENKNQITSIAVNWGK